MQKTTFESLWTKYLEPKTKAHGVVEADLHRVRSAVKTTLVTAGWASPGGDVHFMNADDVNGCFAAAVTVINRVSPDLAAARRVTRSQVQTAAAKVQASTASLEPVAAAAGASGFAPMMAGIGERCPRCSASMVPVALANDRAAVYCARDRVVLPLPSNLQVRDA